MEFKKLNIYLLVFIPLIWLCSIAIHANAFSNYGTYYEIFVRSFYDADGDGIGDLQGIIEKLDYLNDGDPLTDKDLGIKGIWLMPILDSPSYHGYDVTDYYQINPDYGSLTDLQELIREAHRRGIKVIMDLPLNHTSKEHPWFKDAVLDPDSPYRDYYVWADSNTNTAERRNDGAAVWHTSLNGKYYAYFGAGMPDLNYNNPEVRQEMIKVATYWLEQGLDGFRLDGAMHIFPPREYDKNYAWWDKFREELLTVNSELYLVGEIWSTVDTIAPYFKHGFDSAFNFNLAEQILESVNSGFSFGFNNTISRIYATYDRETGGKYIDAPFLTNHDQDRVVSSFLGNWGKAQVAASIYLTLPGNPFIYYGEEIGMQGSKPDKLIREPFQWYEGDGPGETTWEKALNNDGFTSVEKQEQSADSLLNHYRRLIRFRDNNPVLYGGGIQFLELGSNIIAYIRYDDHEELYVYHNISKYERKLELVKGIDWQVVFNTDDLSTPVSEDGKIILKLKPYSTVILKKLDK